MNTKEVLDYTRITRDECIDLNEILGRGGFGEIIAMEYKNVKIACKLCHSREEVFNRELSLLCRYKHDNIIKLIGADKVEKLLFLELADMSLHDVIFSKIGNGLNDDPPPFAYKYLLAHAINWAKQICQGMHFLHTSKVEVGKSLLHRDLKPGNVLMFEGCQIVKLCDFGCSREKNYYSKQLTVEVGTQYYLAPEVLRSHDYDSACDIYSFGCILWNMITRLQIQEGCNYGTNYCALINAALHPDTTFKPHVNDIPEEFNDLMMACCNFTPNLRPSSSDLCNHFDELMSLKLPGGHEKFYNKARQTQAPLKKLFNMSHLLVEKNIRPPSPCKDDVFSKRIYKKSIKTCLEIAEIRIKNEFFKNKRNDLKELLADFSKFDNNSIDKLNRLFNRLTEDQIILTSELNEQKNKALESMKIYNCLETKEK